MRNTHDDESMGSPVVSASEIVAGLFVSDSCRTPEEAMDEARSEMVKAVSDDMDYWARLSSGLYFDEVPEEALADVQDEFKQYALEWKRYGRGAEVISDFAAHRKLRMERFERREAAKKAKAAKKAMRTAGGSRVSWGGCGGSGYNDPELYGPAEAKLQDDPEVVAAVLVEIDAKLKKIDGVCTDLPSIEDFQRDMMVRGFDHMLLSFMDERHKKRYGYNKSDHRSAPLKFGGDVPSYFANVKDQSIHRRKVLSIAGLRNLIMYGPAIYKQLEKKYFSGDSSSYNGDEGLQLMRRVTGNVVDLDTTVLRCSDNATLNAINMSNKHKKLPTFSSASDFSSSTQAYEIAVHCSQPLLEDFAKLFKLNEAACKKRHIHPSQISKPIHVARDNGDRGRYPIWHYQNVGQDSFHANVPTMDDVNGALLKAPFHCLLHWMQIHCLFKGEELNERIDSFFEDCIVDSCFNMKWKAIEEFGAAMEHEGTIVDVLQRAQMDNQGVFTMDFFDADNETRDNEVAEMCKLCVGRIGRDKTKALRSITREDVAAWVDDPAVEI